MPGISIAFSKKKALSVINTAGHRTLLLRAQTGIGRIGKPTAAVYGNGVNAVQSEQNEKTEQKQSDQFITETLPLHDFPPDLSVGFRTDID